jgi:hypothetical protein
LVRGPETGQTNVIGRKLTFGVALDHREQEVLDSALRNCHVGRVLPISLEYELEIERSNI